MSLCFLFEFWLFVSFVVFMGVFMMAFFFVESFRYRLFTTGKLIQVVDLDSLL